MPARQAVHDFGFDPSESPYHFAVTIDAATGRVTVTERFVWPAGDNGTAERPPANKAMLDSDRWQRIAGVAAEVFNRRLAQAHLRRVGWRPEGDTLLAPYFGKELTLLFWVVEDADLTVIPNMVANWVELAPEERWWLYTTVNATSRYAEHGKDRGWRKAIKIAFAENPASSPPPSMLAGYVPPMATQPDPNETEETTGPPAESEEPSLASAKAGRLQGDGGRTARARRRAARQIALPLAQEDTLPLWADKVE